MELSHRLHIPKTVGCTTGVSMTLPCLWFARLLIQHMQKYNFIALDKTRWTGTVFYIANLFSLLIFKADSIFHNLQKDKQYPEVDCVTEPQLGMKLKTPWREDKPRSTEKWSVRAAKLLQSHWFTWCAILWDAHLLRVGISSSVLVSSTPELYLNSSNAQSNTEERACRKSFHMINEVSSTKILLFAGRNI